MSARERILGRIREALEGRERVDHPGDFGGWRPEGTAAHDFLQAFREAGGEVEVLSGPEEALAWLASFVSELGVDDPPTQVSVGASVPEHLRPPGDGGGDPETAPVGVSMARAAVAETGSLVLDARDGRRAQLLPPVHVVWIREEDVRDTLVEALHDVHEDLPSAVGLHSGPSKSADLGQILVKGVHGPGRVVAAVLRRPGEKGASPGPDASG